MAKVPGPYQPLSRGVDDPPPYSTVDPSAPMSSIPSATGPLAQTTSSSSQVPIGFMTPSNNNLLRVRAAGELSNQDNFIEILRTLDKCVQ